jgi:metal-sulfur cluster biosynthetic enzyme
MNTPVENTVLVETIRSALRDVYDPEFGVSIEDMGLIYDISVDHGRAAITMTLTSMYCPAGDVILAGVKAATEKIPGIHQADIALVWEPVWSAERLSPLAREQLGWDVPQTDA